MLEGREKEKMLRKKRELQVFRVKYSDGNRKWNEGMERGDEGG